LIYYFFPSLGVKITGIPLSVTYEAAAFSGFTSITFADIIRSFLNVSTNFSASALILFASSSEIGSNYSNFTNNCSNSFSNSLFLFYSSDIGTSSFLSLIKS